MRRRIGLVMAMEEEMQQPEVQTELLADTDMEGSAETAMLEASDMESEVDGQMDDIDMVANSSDELSNIADVMEKTTENGGMDEQTAEVVEVAVEGIYTRMGVKRFAKMPAMETFGEKTSRLQATRIAIEGVKEFIASAWKKIIEAISSASEFIMNFLKKVFDVNARMMTRAQAYKTKLVGIKSGQSSTPTVPSGSFGKALALSEKTTSFDTEVVKGMQALIKAMQTCVKRAELATEYSNPPAGGVYKIVKLDLSMGQEVSSSDGFDTPDEGMALTRSEMLPGGRAFVSQYFKAGSEKDMKPDMMKNIKVYVGDFNPKKELSFKGETVKTATVEDMSKIVDTVLDLAKLVVQGKAVSDKLFNARKTLITCSKELLAKDRPSEEAKMQQLFAVAYNQLTKTFMVDFNKFSVSTGMQALNYVQKSMETYKGSPPASKEAQEKPVSK